MNLSILLSDFLVQICFYQQKIVDLLCYWSAYFVNMSALASAIAASQHELERLILEKLFTRTLRHSVREILQLQDSI